jgi:hypothetical protein
MAEAVEAEAPDAARSVPAIAIANRLRPITRRIENRSMENLSAAF